MLVYADHPIFPSHPPILINRYISPILMLVYADHRISPSHLPHPNARLYWPSHLSVASPPS